MQRSGWRFGVILAAGVATLLALGACVEDGADIAPSAVTHVQIERREGVSLAPATVAVVSVDGAPDNLKDDFANDLRREATAREITIVDPKKAKYLVRGYLSATLNKDGAALEYVWDVFGPDRRRAQRLNDVVEVKGTGDDPWAMIGEAALSSAAAKSADDLAAFLSTTPEAKPIPMAQAAPPLSDSALGYAPVQ